MIKRLNVDTKSHAEFIDITSRLKDIVSDLGIQDGMLIVYVAHTTAGITINESADPSVKADILKTLDKNVPWNDNYSHAEGNSAAHIKASLMGSSVTILIEKGSLVLGTWQGVFFCEFDGPRSRKVVVQAIKYS